MINLHDIANNELPDTVKSWTTEVKMVWKNQIVIRYRRYLKVLDFQWVPTNDTTWYVVSDGELDSRKARSNYQQQISLFKLDMLNVE